MRNPLVRLIGFLLASACFLCACAVQDPDPSSCISSKEDDVSSLLSTVSPSGGSSAEQTEPPSSQTPDDPSGPDTPASSETPPDPSSQAGASSDRPSITKKADCSHHHTTHLPSSVYRTDSYPRTRGVRHGGVCGETPQSTPVISKTDTLWSNTAGAHPKSRCRLLPPGAPTIMI